MEKQIDNITLELRQGDITKQPDLDAVVNAANAELMPGGGVAGAIHKAAGAELAEACRPLAPIERGEAVITDAFELPNKRIIHCLGPVYGVDQPSDKILEQCYINGLKVADENGLLSVGFPAISTGAFGYPIEPAADIALQTVKARSYAFNRLQKVVFVLFDKKDYQVFEKALEKL